MMSKEIKRTFLLLTTGIVGTFIHNIYFGLMGKEDVIFFYVSIASLFLFSLSTLYYTIKHVRKGEPKDLWRIGYLGFLGFIGFTLQSGGNLFGLFGFFGYFGFYNKKK